MEVKEGSIPVWLEKTHPNYERWKRSRYIALERGKFVLSIIEQEIPCKGLTVLDLGSGQGGTARILAQNNNVFSLDIDKSRLNSQKDFTDIFFRINGNALNIPFKRESFDLIILQDVIEHLNNPVEIFSLLIDLLKQNGLIYLSTPNKFSVFNIIADPHWGLPLISILDRETIRKLFLRYFRKTEFHRTDIAQLFSLTQLQELFDGNFKHHLNTRFSTKELLNGNKGIVWSDFHLNILKLIKMLRLNRMVRNISNDNFGFVNKFITPTFYFLLKKLKN